MTIFSVKCMPLFLILFALEQFNAEMQMFGSNKEYIPEKATFCNSHRRCFERGMTKGMTGYLIGKEYRELDALKLSKSGIWLNYHALLYSGTPNESEFWTFGETSGEHSQTIFHDYIDSEWLSRYQRLSFYSTNFVIESTASPTISRTFACGYRPIHKASIKIQREIFRLDKEKNTAVLCFSKGPGYGCTNSLQNVTLISCGKM